MLERWASLSQRYWWRLRRHWDAGLQVLKGDGIGNQEGARRLGFGFSKVLASAIEKALGCWTSGSQRCWHWKSRKHWDVGLCVLEGANQCCYIYTSNWVVAHKGGSIQKGNCPPPKFSSHDCICRMRRMMNVMGGITASCQHCQIGCCSLLGYSRSLLRVVGHRLMRKFSVHPIPRVHIVPSGMFRVRQGERDRVQSKNPVVAGLRDPRTPPERPCCNRAPSPWPRASRPPALCVLPSSLNSVVH